MEELPRVWREFLSPDYDSAGMEAILARVDAERKDGTQVFPPTGKLFHALELTPPEAVRVVLLGQDPYHGAGQAEGLAFSVPGGVKFPPSLRNIFREYASDLGRSVPESGSLRNWAENGVLLLNCVLSVHAHEAGSHRKFGWEKFTDSVIRSLNHKSERVVFLLWGNFAQAKRPLIDETRHTVLVNVHPSPLSAHRGFFGSCPFSQTEQALSGWMWPEL